MVVILPKLVLPTGCCEKQSGGDGQPYLSLAGRSSAAEGVQCFGLRFVRQRRVWCPHGADRAATRAPALGPGCSRPTPGAEAMVHGIAKDGSPPPLCGEGSKHPDMR